MTIRTILVYLRLLSIFKHRLKTSLISRSVESSACLLSYVTLSFLPFVLLTVHI